MKFDRIGEVGLPCGRKPRQQHIWANTVATSVVKLKGELRNKPLIRPKLIDEKKSAKSRFTTIDLFTCCVAFETIFWFWVNPCTHDLFLYMLVNSSLSVLWINISGLRGELICLMPPAFFSILKELYFLFSGKRYNKYFNAVGLNPRKAATSSISFSDSRLNKLVFKNRGGSHNSSYWLGLLMISQHNSNRKKKSQEISRNQKS